MRWRDQHCDRCRMSEADCRLALFAWLSIAFANSVLVAVSPIPSVWVCAHVVMVAVCLVLSALMIGHVR